MKPNTSPELYVKQKGWHYRLKGGEENGKPQINVEVCPLCGKDKWHFFVNKTTGEWDCKHCQERGRSLVSLKFKVGDLIDPIAVSLTHPVSCFLTVDLAKVRQLHGALWNSKDAMDWCRSRRWSDETIRHFRLGYEDGWIVFPYFRDGKCVNLKFRSLAEKTFRWIPGFERPLYGIDAVKNATRVVVVEGESDYIALWQSGRRDVVSIPSGAGTFTPECWEPLLKLDRVYLALDNDGPGQRGAKRIADRLGADRCYHVAIEGHKDVRDFLDAGGDFQVLIDQAVPRGTPTVYGAYDAVEHVRFASRVALPGYITPWPAVNRHVAPLGPGQMLSLIGASKQGKTTWASQWLNWLAVVKNVPCFFYCLDMDLTAVSNMVVSQVLRKPRSQLDDSLRSQAMLYLHRAPLYISTYAPEITIDSVCEQIELAVVRHGIEVVAFDHLHNLCRGSENYFRDVSLCSARFKELSQRLKIGLIVLHQPTKLGKGQEPELYSASGSSMIPADSTTIISLYRKPIRATGDDESESAFEVKTKVSVHGSHNAAGGFCHLWLEGEWATFKNSENGPPPCVKVGSVGGWEDATVELPE